MLNEFVHVARRKLRKNWDEIDGALTDIRGLCAPPIPLTAASQDAAMKIAMRYSFSIYDSSIIASALEAGCDILYSEDMQHSQRIEGLRIVNPFR